MIKICEICGNSFETKTARQFKYKRCCTQSCSNKLMWKENRQKMIDAHNNPDAKLNNSQKQKERWSDAKYKERMHNIKKEVANRPENKEQFKQRLSEWRNNPDTLEQFYAMRKEIANRPEMKRNVSECHQKLWADSEYRSTQIEKFSNGQLRRWSNPNNAIDMFKNAVKYKEYAMPSGKIVKLQGYEPQVLNELLKTHSEENLLVEVSAINDEIGIIKYMFEDKERTYYPDFYIKSENKIIEVKSQWTFDKWKEKNLAKQNACLEQGFQFEFIILK